MKRKSKQIRQHIMNPNTPGSAVPGPPFLPKYVSRADPGQKQSETDQMATMDGIGQTMWKTMNHLVRDAHHFAAFFCKANLNSIQDQLMVAVRNSSNYIIERQSDEMVLILMRTVYLNNVNKITPIERMNQEVVDYATKNIILNIHFSVTNQQRMDSAFVPLEYGISDTMSIRGRVSN